jgi:tRNA (guanosine-2'-O-)-methyltransferase
VRTGRRPPRAWLGEARLVDPAELVGPRGLTEAVLAGRSELGEPLEDDGAAADASIGTAAEDAFFASLLTEERRARIESVIDARLDSVTAVLDRLYDPHNVAAIVRTAEGLGLCELHIVPNADGDDVAHRRVTQDADKWLGFVQHATGALAAQALRARGFSVFAGHLDARAVPLENLPVHRPIALLFGHEHEGPSAETLAACDGTFRISMAGFVQSFNVSVAAALALYQATRGRRAFLGRAGDLGPAAKARLRSRFVRLACKLARRLHRRP